MSNESKKVDQDAVEAKSNQAEEVKKTEELAEKPTPENTAEEPTAKETRAEEPTAKETPAEEPTAKEIPAEEPTAKEIPAEEPTAKEIPAEEPTAKEIPAEEPTAKEIPAEEPTAKETPAEEPAAEESQPVAETSEALAEEPAAEESQPVAETSEAPAEEPAAEEPQPVAETSEAPAEEPQAAAPKKSPKKSSKPVSAENTGDADFDWDEFAADELEGTENKAEFEKLYSDTLSTIAENEVIDGTVISLNKREVVINIGYKSEGVISLSEFRYDPDLKPGDKVEVYVESQEDKKGQLVLSHKKARAMRSWDRVNQSLEQDEVIKGYIKCRTKGGMIVDVFGIEAFLPGSQIDVKPIRDYDAYVGKNMEFKVVKINHEFKNVVVSHKALIEEELEQQKKEIIAKLEKGQVLEGTVKNITSYGVFIDLGGVDGLIHITDLSWGRVNHPEEIVELDQKLNVVILDFDDDKKRIALGLKQLTPHPWDSLDENMKVGDQVKGRVVVMADYGAFVEIAPGVEGLIHVSEMSWSQHLRSAQEFMKVGDEVDAVILTLDREERKMSLGIKQLKPDPWEKIDEKYAVGSRHTAKVRNFTNFGVFVEIEEGVDGLIHISDLSWTKKIKHPAEFTSIAADIEVVVLEIDKDNRRLSLGHKQMEENPWDVFESVFGVDSIHEGTIIELMDKGAVVALPYGVEGFVTPKHLVKEDGSPVKVDEKLDFKVIEFNKSAKKIILSHSRIHEDEQKSSVRAEKQSEGAEVRKASRKIKSNLEKTTLGDISELAALKTSMEESEKKDKKDKKKEGSDKK
jgi:small subunit ribosomal protein S1